MNTKDFIKDLKILEDIFDFSILDENHELFSIKNKIVVGKFKCETPENIWINEFVCLGSIMFSFKCGDDSKTKLEDVSKYQYQSISKMRNKEIVQLVKNINENVIIILFDQLIMKCILEK